MFWLHQACGCLTMATQSQHIWLGHHSVKSLVCSVRQNHRSGHRFTRFGSTCILETQLEALPNYVGGLPSQNCCTNFAKDVLPSNNCFCTHKPLFQLHASSCTCMDMNTCTMMHFYMTAIAGLRHPSQGLRMTADVTGSITEPLASSTVSFLHLRLHQSAVSGGRLSSSLTKCLYLLKSLTCVLCTA